ncbi:hypothetical protein E2C01_040484 [Portunus trituberculatus]|uniref:Uncharacterized protein n=1 Tax=Portunus trituberculatus TaxID=210409 RepID=A0A5B7FN48_PORTR|nr:hypothetical protein [Portunus trituberculatus]
MLSTSLGRRQKRGCSLPAPPTVRIQKGEGAQHATQELRQERFLAGSLQEDPGYILCRASVWLTQM